MTSFWVVALSHPSIPLSPPSAWQRKVPFFIINSLELGVVVGRLSIDESDVELGRKMCQISLKLGWEYGRGPNVSMVEYWGE